MCQDIIEYNNAFVATNNRLRKIAPDYPEIHREEIGTSLYFATWVPFEYEGRNYKRIHIESAIISPTYTEQQLKNRMEHYIELTKTKAIPHPIDQTITLT